MNMLLEGGRREMVVSGMKRSKMVSSGHVEK